MMTGITYIFFQVVYCLAEEEKTINPLAYKSLFSSTSLSLSLSLIYFYVEEIWILFVGNYI